MYRDMYVNIKKKSLVEIEEKVLQDYLKIGLLPVLKASSGFSLFFVILFTESPVKALTVALSSLALFFFRGSMNPIPLKLLRFSALTLY